MDNDLHVRDAFDGLYGIIANTSISDLNAGEASGVVKTLREIDQVLQVIF